MHERVRRDLASVLEDAERSARAGRLSYDRLTRMRRAFETRDEEAFLAELTAMVEDPWPGIPEGAGR